MPVTIDQAIEILTKAKEQIGGDGCLVLSLTDSGLPDTDISGITIVNDGEIHYIQVECRHLDLTEVDLEYLVNLAKYHNISAEELAKRTGTPPDRLNNGGVREIIHLLLQEGEDENWLASLISR